MRNRVEPKISVVTIFLDGLPWLEEAIQSVLAQTDVDLEYILVDDGSSDGSSAIARSFAARFPDTVRYIDHPGHANRGMSASRNAGVAVANGEFLAFIDADDVWLPDKLSRQLGWFAKHSEIVMVCDSAIYWYSWGGGKDEPVLAGPVQDAVVLPPMALLETYPLGRGHAPCPSGILIRKSAYEEVGGFEASFTGPLQMYEDQAFFSKIYLDYAVLFTRDCGLLYRQHPASCVAENMRSGLYDQVRLHFLQWLGSRLGKHDTADRRVRRAWRRAMRPYRFPVLYTCSRRTHAFARIVAHTTIYRAFRVIRRLRIVS